MDFTATEAQLDLARLTGEVCDKLVTADRLRELDSVDAKFDEPLWKSLAETGVLAAALPEEAGGNGFGALEQTAIQRELGKALGAVPYLWSIVLGAGALARFGSDTQRELARAAAEGGTILTVALAEERNWQPEQPQTSAVETADGWRISGVKTTVPVADRATRVLVPANVADTTAVFLVDPTVDSVTVTAQQVTDRSAESLVEFADTPGELLGTVERGTEILDWLLVRAWLGLAARQLGTLESALDLVADYAREREQFGRAIGGFQAVSQRLSDGYIAIGGLRLTVTQAAWQLSEGLDATGAVHTAKFWAAEAGHQVAHTVVHVHGGVGIDRDHTAHNYFTAAKHNEFALGGSPDHLLPLAQYLPDSA